MAIAKQTTATVIPALQYRDAPAAIDFLCMAFGFEKKAVYEGEGGSIAHAQLTLGNGMVMLGSVKEILSGSIPIDTLPKRKDTHWLSRRCGGRCRGDPAYRLQRDHVARPRNEPAEWAVGSTGSMRKETP